MSSVRQELVAAYRHIAARGLAPGASGNVSMRVADGFLITPSGRMAAEIDVADLVPMTLDGRAKGVGKPSSEWPMHAAILDARPEVAAVVHGHPPFATALACHRRTIPPFHYMVAMAGGEDIRCADYATFGTAELANNVVVALEGRTACLLANHGLIAVGADIAAAVRLAEEVEVLAEQYWRALQLGAPVLLDGEEMARVLDKFRDYRRPDGG